MTANEFNLKYKDYLEEGHYGAKEFNNPDFLDWLDEKFQTFITKPNFSFSQIKIKFGMGRFYCNGLDEIEIREVEDKISSI